MFKLPPLGDYRREVYLNFTQHKATPDQLKAGVVDLKGDELIVLKKNLTFDDLPSSGVLFERAVNLVDIAEGYKKKNGKEELVHVMIGGAPFLMPLLEQLLTHAGFDVFYAFSKRESIEEIVDEKVIKKSIFKHLGFVSGALLIDANDN